MVAGKKRVHQSIGLKDQNCVVFYDKTDIRNRWYEYCKSLFAEDTNLIDSREWDKVSFEDEPSVLKEEIRAAIKRMRCGKAVGLEFSRSRNFRRGVESGWRMCS